MTLDRNRWERLRSLVRRCERLFAANTRIDACGIRSAPRDRLRASVRERLDALELRLDKEIDRITYVRLRADWLRFSGPVA